MRVAVKLFGSFEVNKHWITFPLTSVDYVIFDPDDTKALVMLKNGLVFRVGLKAMGAEQTNRGELDALVGCTD